MFSYGRHLCMYLWMLRMTNHLSIPELIREIRKCKICKEHLPFDPKPIFSFSNRSKILVIGQAPGIKVHNSGIPWKDASGNRLRDWLNVSEEDFYDTRNFGIVPMGFCYPGKGKSGDLPPRPECAKNWMDPILYKLKEKKILILVGQYAHKYFLQKRNRTTLTRTVQNWQDYIPEFIVLPHPSPRNNIWLRKNSWFEKEVIPAVQERISTLIKWFFQSLS